MKILESQSAALTNHEVLVHIQKLHARPSTTPLKASNYETVIKELQTHLSPPPNYFNSPRPPPSYAPPDFTSEKLRRLVKALAPYKMMKAEVLMILNLRPDSVALLTTIVEDCEQRYSDEQQAEILAAIGDVLGWKEKGDKEGDAAMVNGVNGHEGAEVNGHEVMDQSR